MSTPPNTPRLALVFSGGGARGAFGAGVLYQLRQTYPELVWDIVSGTSTGALIAPFAVLGLQDPTYFDTVANLYRSARFSDILEWNFLPSDGLFNLHPLKNRIEAHLKQPDFTAIRGSDVCVILNATDLQTGELVLCTQPQYQNDIYQKLQQSLPRVRFVDFDNNFECMMLASSSMPVFMSTGTCGGNSDRLVDGGLVDIAPLRAAKAASATHAVCVLMQNHEPFPVARPSGTAGVGLRALSLIECEILRNDVADTSMAIQTRNYLSTNGLLSDSNVVQIVNWLDQAAGVLEEVHVIQPKLDIDSDLEFNKKVPSDWPENSTGAFTSIMEARFQYGRRIVQGLASGSAEEQQLDALLSNWPSL